MTPTREPEHDLLYVKALEAAEKRLYIKKNYARTASISFGYLRYRLVRPLLKIYNQMLLPRNAPWMAPAAAAIFDAVLNRNMLGFEFGSGRSTLFLGSRLNTLTSLEHDPGWYEQVKRTLALNGVNNVSIHLMLKDATDKPELIHSREDDLQTSYVPATCFKNYYSFIEQRPEKHFDVIVIDGRARVECAEKSLPKLKPGGILVLDNSERKRYRSIHVRLSDWRKINTTTGLTDTTFWFKPINQV